MSRSHPLLPPSTDPSRPLFFAPSVAEVQTHTFHPHSSLAIASTATAQSAGVGLLVSAVQNALGSGAAGIITRSGGTIAFFAAMGFSFSFGQAVTANIRETDDALNAAAGGCAAGFIAGVRARSLPMAVGACAALGTATGTFAAAGNSLTGTGRLNVSRPEREERRLKFFKQKGQPEAKDAMEVLS